jgi:hypothetical protein
VVLCLNAEMLVSFMIYCDVTLTFNIASPINKDGAFSNIEDDDDERTSWQSTQRMVEHQTACLLASPAHTSATCNMSMSD